MHFFIWDFAFLKMFLYCLFLLKIFLNIIWKINILKWRKILENKRFRNVFSFSILGASLIYEGEEILRLFSVQNLSVKCFSALNRRNLFFFPWRKLLFFVSINFLSYLVEIINFCYSQKIKEKKIWVWDTFWLRVLLCQARYFLSYILVVTPSFSKVRNGQSIT